MSDGKYFSSQKKGEVAEYRAELRDSKLEVRKEAVKKVIAAMTVGIDVEMLFPDMILCMNTDDIELKKLVYLYIINYARVKRNRGTVLLAVNTFVKDSQHGDPLLRALAVRTMGCIRVEQITEYLVEPIAQSLKDHDPYVRKTAALCIAKLYDLRSDVVEARGFIETLHELLADDTPMVVANTVAALTEIQQISSSNVFVIGPSTLHKLLKALDECTEWGQILILDTVAKYTPESFHEAEGTIDRVVPRLSHGNGAVVMGAIRVILQFLAHARDKDFIKQTCRKLAPPIVTLMSGAPEVQYVTLRNISIIVQRRPKILENQFRVFFCKYNDLAYVKYEKLEVLFKLANIRNIEELLNELKEYALEVDVEMARRAVRLIGRCAIKLEQGAQMCIDVLVELIGTEIKHIVQETIVVMKDVYRRYPNQFEELVRLMHEALGSDDLEPEAEAAMIWIIGEYAERIDDADEMLEFVVFGDEDKPKVRRDIFNEEPLAVRIELLIASVKLFLKTDGASEALVKEVLDFSHQSPDPDLRMRSFVYWRLLSGNPEAAKQVVLADKPEVSTDSQAIEPSLLDQLMSNISTLAAVYHIAPERLIVQSGQLEDGEEEEDEDGEEDDESNAPASQYMESAPAEDYEDDDVDDDEDDEEPESPHAKQEDPVDLMGAPADPMPMPGGALEDLLGVGDMQSNNAAVQQSSAPMQQPSGMSVVCSAQAGGGLQVMAKFERKIGFNGERVYLVVQFTNFRPSPINMVDMRFNKNSFGLVQQGLSHDGQSPAQAGAQTLHPGVAGMPLQPQSSISCEIAMDFTSAAVLRINPLLDLQVAIKVDGSANHVYFVAPCPLHMVYQTNPSIEKRDYMQMWKDTPNEEQVLVPNPSNLNAEQVKSILTARNFLIVHERDSAEGTVIYVCAVTESACEVWCLATMTISSANIDIKVKCQENLIAPFTQTSFSSLFEDVSTSPLDGLMF